MNKKVFYDSIRSSVFGGRLSAKQVEGIEFIMGYKDSKYPDLSMNEMAYILATTAHETAYTMQPIKERGSTKYLKSKRYYPWIGRGYVQITWEENYLKYGITNPDDALKPEVAVHVLFDGMINGRFTGKKLSDYINSKYRDFVGARKIINGTDRDLQIARVAENFEAALFAAKEAAPEDIQDVKDVANGKKATKSTTIFAQIAQWLTAGGASSLVAFGKVDWKVAAVLGGVAIAGFGLYIIYERIRHSKEYGV